MELSILDKMKNYELELHFMDAENLCHEIVYVLEELVQRMADNVEVLEILPLDIKVLMLCLSASAVETIDRLYNKVD